MKIADRVPEDEGTYNAQGATLAPVDNLKEGEEQ